MIGAKTRQKPNQSLSRLRLRGGILFIQRFHKLRNRSDIVRCRQRPSSPLLKGRRGEVGASRGGQHPVHVAKGAERYALAPDQELESNDYSNLQQDESGGEPAKTRCLLLILTPQDFD